MVLIRSLHCTLTALSNILCCMGTHLWSLGVYTVLLPYLTYCVYGDTPMVLIRSLHCTHLVIACTYLTYCLTVWDTPMVLIRSLHCTPMPYLWYIHCVSIHIWYSMTHLWYTLGVYTVHCYCPI